MTDSIDVLHRPVDTLSVVHHFVVQNGSKWISPVPRDLLEGSKTVSLSKWVCGEFPSLGSIA